MTQAIVNITLPLIKNKTEEILRAYPRSPYQQLFSETAWYEQLVAYVVRRMPVEYIATENKACSVDMPATCFSQEQHQQVDRLINEGIQHLASHYEARKDKIAANANDGVSSLSTWFG